MRPYDLQGCISRFGWRKIGDGEGWFGGEAEAGSLILVKTVSKPG